MNYRMLSMLLGAGMLTALAITNPAYGQNLTAEQSIRIYLMQDCGTGESDPAKLLKDVLNLGDAAIPLLLVALGSGPSEEARGELRRGASRDYKKMRTFLERGGLDALKNEDIRKGARDLNEDTYVTMRMTGFVRGYRERALNALIALGNKNVIDSLEKIQKQQDIDDALKAEIGRGIETLRTRKLPE